MKYTKFLSLLIFSIFFCTNVNAKNLDLTRYKNFYLLEVPESIITPKVVKFETDNLIEGGILINEKNEVISHKLISRLEKINSQKIFVSDVSSVFQGEKNYLVDKNINTSLVFHPEKDLEKSIVLEFGKNIDISGVFVTLSQGVIEPQKISVSGKFDEKGFVNILKNIDFERHIPFPKISVQALKISFDSPHFLGISEVEILGQSKQQKKETLIFFAQPGGKYKFFVNPSFGQKNFYPKKHQPLKTDNSSPVFEFSEKNKNKEYNDDFDGDGIPDKKDLCPKIKDSKNLDIDKNGKGDVCEDPDVDGIFSIKDNCPFVYNPSQKDQDLDNIGDKCDTEENRLTENIQYLLYGIFGLVGLVLGILVIRSFKKS